MQNFGFPGRFGLENIGSQNEGSQNTGLHNLKGIYWNLTPAELIQQAISRQEGILAASGALVVSTGKYTGRSPEDKFLASTQDIEEMDIWWGKINQPLDPEKFRLLFYKMKAYLQGRDVFVEDLHVGAHPSHRTSVRIISEKAWASLFSQNLLRRLSRREMIHFKPDYTIIHCPDFHTVPEEDGTKSETVIALDFSRRLVLIGGTSYAGEIKKSVFSVMNYLLPQQNILPMHCSANIGKRGDVALFFGLSGTGKTTLSSDPDRRLIGDDEHGWNDEGVFNIEGGCYAKTIHLSHKLEPLIWQAVNRFGTVLENVTCDPDTRRLDFDDSRQTENTRAAYPLEFIPNHSPEGYAGHPENIFFLTADAFGVMPPIARLTAQQAMYYFLSGYTSKLAGTEKGLGSDPQATFSACFGAPFLPLHPFVYANLLGEKIKQNTVTVWLINTGWTGGSYGFGHRILLPYTRVMIKAALNHLLDDVPFHPEPFFGLFLPQSCPGIPDHVLDPLKTWTEAEAYQKQARILIERFTQNFNQFAGSVPQEVILAGPRAGDHLADSLQG
ncbi:MAG: phosphoenolpyruvate carboxykinase (ATP) [Anaerolineaceae bacterium]|nr:phosphoenolpyruvate carboxykinase (ATP) [Anaerolineaceae bacterium]